MRLAILCSMTGEGQGKSLEGYERLQPVSGIAAGCCLSAAPVVSDGDISEHFRGITSGWQRKDFRNAAKRLGKLPTLKSLSARPQTDKTLLFLHCLRSLEGREVIYIGQIKVELYQR